MIVHQTLAHLHSLKLGGMAAAFEEQLSLPTGNQTRRSKTGSPCSSSAKPPIAAPSASRRCCAKHKLKYATRHLEDIDQRASRGLDRPAPHQPRPRRMARARPGRPDHRAHRRRQDLARLRARATRLPPRQDNVLHPCAQAPRGTARRPWRWHPQVPARRTRQARPAGAGRLGLARDGCNTAREDLLDVVDDRSDRRATVITGQLPVEHWHAWIAEPTVADAILDRLLHHAHRITLKGESLRRRTPFDPEDSFIVTPHRDLLSYT